MKRPFQTGVFPFFRAARGILTALPLALVAATCFLPQWAVAALSGAQPVISVGVYNELGYPVHSAVKASDIRYTFEAQVELPSGGPLLKGDLYFGILAHKSDQSLSWTASGDAPTLVRGMVPLIENIDMNTPQTINLETYTEGEFAHVFAGAEQAGLYFIFVLLVAADRDPGDPQNWSGVRMEPFVVRDMPLQVQGTSP